MLDGRPSGNRHLSNAYIREDGSLTGMTNGASTITNNTWYFLRAYRTGTTLSAEIYNDLYGSAMSTTNRTSESTYSTGYTGVFVYSNMNANYDNFRVRKRANPEPAYTTWGGQTTQSAVITASSTGSQTADVYIPSTVNYLGGKFALTSSVPTSITSIKLAEQGTINAQTGLDNIKLLYDLDTSNPYDCTSESFAGTETQYGSTDTDGFDGANGSSTFTGSVSLSSTATMCMYVVADVTTSAGNGETIEIQITNPNNDIQSLTGTVTPNTAVTLSGTTTASVPGWYNSGWLKRKRMTIDSDSMGSGSTDLIDFPMGITLTSDAELSAFAQADGDDILFTDANGTTKLDHEIEEYTSASGRTVVWVKIPALRKTTDTVIYMYYGNASASNQQSTGTWSNYKGVWHMAQNPGGSAPQVVDSTANANNLTSAGSMTSGDSISGLIGKAINFDGSNDALSVSDPANGSLDITTEDYSIEAWIRTSNSASSMHLFGKGAFGAAGYRVYLNHNFSSRPGTTVWGNSSNVDSTPGSYSHSLTNGSWHHLVVTYDRDGNAVFYIDGNQVTTLNISSVNGQTLANSDIFYVARYAGSQFWNGDIDELRIINGVLTSSWISTAYNNVAAFQTPNLSSAETQPGIGDVIVSASGTQVTPLDYPQESKYIGGSFALRSLGTSTNVTAVTLSESGSMDATYIDNVKLYYDLDTSSPYDCASESYGGSESQFGSTNSSGFTAANGTAQVSAGGGVGISTTSTLCLYPVFDLTASITDDTVMEIAIANPSTDITLSSGSITATSAVELSGSSTMNDINAPWYNTSWAYRKRIVVQDSQVSGSSDLTNFPMLVSLTSDSQLAANAQDDSDDILFASGDGTTKLDHEIATFNGSTGELQAWVRIPTLAATANTTVYMYYGNSLASAQQNIDGTWSSEYVGVWHMEQDPSGSAPQLRNSADNTLDGTANGTMTSGDLIAGKIGGAYDFDGSDDYINMGDKNTLDMGTSDFVVQSWTKLATTAGAAAKIPILAKGAWGQTGIRYEINNNGPRYSFRLDNMEVVPGSYDSLADDTWRFGTIVFDRNVTAYVYVDGTQQATTSISSSSASISNSENFYIARNGGGNYFPIKIDELRMRTGLLTSDWIATEYNNHNSPSTFIFLANQEMTNAAPTVTSVTLNGGSNIDLTENTTTSISWTASVTDSNGYADISSASGKLYRSGVTNGATCTPDTNNCYAAASCSLSSCSGNSCTATCTVNVQFHADPTDTGSSFASEYWLAQVTATDSASSQHSATSPASVTEVNSLVAASVTNSISYGTLLPGNDSSTENETVVVTNAGNVPIDVEVSGSALCPDHPTCASDTIPVGNQEYGLSAFTYGSGTDLSASGTLVQLNLAKPTQSPSNQTSTLYWGIGIPGSLTPGTYTGINQIIGVADQ